VVSAELWGVGAGNVRIGLKRGRPFHVTHAAPCGAIGSDSGRLIDAGNETVSGNRCMGPTSVPHWGRAGTFLGVTNDVSTVTRIDEAFAGGTLNRSGRSHRPWGSVWTSRGQLSQLRI
jgi:hypothetical protein